MNAPRIAQSARMDLRLSPEAKSLIEKAALYDEQTLTDYALAHLVQSARETIERHERIVLTESEAERFIAALDAPPRKIPALEELARRYTEATTRG